jgi:hypothetical protein
MSAKTFHSPRVAGGFDLARFLIDDQAAMHPPYNG